MPPKKTYMIPVDAKLAQRYTGWTSIEEFGVKWFRIDLQEDGTNSPTAYVWFSTDKEKPDAS